MGACKNTFILLSDEDGEVDVSKLTEKAAEIEMMKKRIQKVYKNIHLLPSWHSIGFPSETNNNAAVEEGGEEDWEVSESSRRRRDGGQKLGGEGGSAGAVVVERNEVKKVEEKEEGGCESEEEYEHVGLAMEQITKGKHNRRRINTWRKKEAAAIRKLKGFDRH